MFSPIFIKKKESRINQAKNLIHRKKSQ